MSIQDPIVEALDDELRKDCRALQAVAEHLKSRRNGFGLGGLFGPSRHERCAKRIEELETVFADVTIGAEWTPLVRRLALLRRARAAGLPTHRFLELSFDQFLETVAQFLARPDRRWKYDNRVRRRLLVLLLTVLVWPVTFFARFQAEPLTFLVRALPISVAVGIAISLVLLRAERYP